MKLHTFRPRDPCGPPLGLGAMSPRDSWRYQRSLERFRSHYGEPKPLMRGEVGEILGFDLKPSIPCVKIRIPCVKRYRGLQARRAAFYDRRKTERVLLRILRGAEDLREAISDAMLDAAISGTGVARIGTEARTEAPHW